MFFFQENNNFSRQKGVQNSKGTQPSQFCLKLPKKTTSDPNEDCVFTIFFLALSSITEKKKKEQSYSTQH